MNMFTRFMGLMGATFTFAIISAPASAFTIAPGFTGYDISIETGVNDFTFSGMFSATSSAFSDNQLQADELGDWMFDVTGQNGGSTSFSKSQGDQITFFIAFPPALPSQEVQLLVQSPPSNLQAFTDSLNFNQSSYTGPEGIDFAFSEPSFTLTQKFPTEQVPEPLTILGSVATAGMIYVARRRKLAQ